MRKEGHTEVYEQISGDNTEQYGTGTQRSLGSLSVPRRWQDICLPSHGDAAEYPEEPPFRQNAKRLQGGRHRNTTDYYGEGPGGPYANSTGIFTESGSWTNASDGQPSDDERTRQNTDIRMQGTAEEQFAAISAAACAEALNDIDDILTDADSVDYSPPKQTTPGTTSTGTK